MSWKALRPGDPPEVGPYQLVGRLGSGGMGIVYLGQDATGVRAAVKVMREEYTTDEGSRSRFHREATAVSRIDSPHIARLLAADVDGDAPWLATEYVEGPTLFSSVTADGPLTGERLWQVARGLAAALCAIHDAGVVHRDLKPGNVMLAPDGPKVIDFGIVAGPPSTMTGSGVVLGSIGYLAPELLTTTRRARPAADVFSWGLTVAFAATGQPPFGAGPLDALLYRTVYGEPELDGLPATLRGVVAATLRKKPERRPDAAKLLTQLGAAEQAANARAAGAAATGAIATGAGAPAGAANGRSGNRPGRLATVLPSLGATAVAAAVTTVILIGTSTPDSPVGTTAAGGPNAARRHPSPAEPDGSPTDPQRAAAPAPAASGDTDASGDAAGPAPANPGAPSAVGAGGDGGSATHPNWWDLVPGTASPLRTRPGARLAANASTLAARPAPALDGVVAQALGTALAVSGAAGQPVTSFPITLADHIQPASQVPPSEQAPPSAHQPAAPAPSPATGGPGVVNAASRGTASTSKPTGGAARDNARPGTATRGSSSGTPATTAVPGAAAGSGSTSQPTGTSTSTNPASGAGADAACVPVAPWGPIPLLTSLYCGEETLSSLATWWSSVSAALSRATTTSAIQPTVDIG